MIIRYASRCEDLNREHGIDLRPPPRDNRSCPIPGRG